MSQPNSKRKSIQKSNLPQQIWKSKKSRTRNQMKWRRQRQRNLVNDFNVSDCWSTSPSTTAPNFDNCIVYNANHSNGKYFLITDLHSTYQLQPDLCGYLQLIPFNPDWSIYCEGFRAIAGEIMSVSTCFGHKIFLSFFIDPASNQSKINLNDFEFVGENLSKLICGEYALLKYEPIHKSLAKYRIVLEYLCKSSNEKVRQICGKKLSTFSDNANDCQDFISKINDCNYNESLSRIEQVYSRIKMKNNDKILIFGQSNCGKTTLINYLINKYLCINHNKSVTYLECDPGQSEFTPCGILGLVEIKQKISNALGHKYLFHQNNDYIFNDDNNLVSKAFGTITPAANTFEYLSLIRQLARINDQMNLSEKRPLFINTIGWIEELGFELLMNIIIILKPSIIIGIVDDSSILSCPIMNTTLGEMTERLKRKLDINTNHFDMFGSSDERIELSKYKCQLMTFPFILNMKKTIFSIPYLRREINQLLYVCTNLWPQISYKPFFSIEPIKFELNENIFFHFINSIDAAMMPNSIYLLSNVQWVYLCRLDHTNENYHAIDLLDEMNIDDAQTTTITKQMKIKLLQELPINNQCYACGIMRNVDMINHTIYITLSSSKNIDLNLINLLIIPNLIPIPSGLLAEQYLYQDSNQLPYSFIKMIDKK